MKWNSLLSLACFLIVFADSALSDGVLRKRFEYKYSFKGPHLVQKDRTVPFWQYIGNSIASDDFMRVAPSLKSQRGLVWNKYATEFDNWEVEMTFKVSGRGRVGADGLAFWYLNDDKAMTGPVFGASDKWKGLAVFFDSFDNDGQNNNPYISAMINDGTRQYDHNSDGASQQIGGCMRDFRNKPFPIKARIRYENQILMVYTSSGNVRRHPTPDAKAQHEESDRFDVCIYSKNIILPKGGHFALSAATGAIADDHDVLSFVTHSLRSEDEMKAQVVKDEEKLKYEKEFEEYEKKLNEARDDYKKEHPDAQKPIEQDGAFAGEAREMRMIFEGQDAIFYEIRNINKRINELLGLQERVSSQISGFQGGAMQAGGAPAPPSGGTGGIQRHEVDTLIRQTNDIMSSLNAISRTVDEVSRQKRSNDPVQGYAQQNHEVSDRLETISKDMQTLILRSNRDSASAAAAASQQNCPEVSCVSTLYFGGFILAQIAVLLCYTLWRSRSESAAKKFY